VTTLTPSGGLGRAIEDISREEGSLGPQIRIRYLDARDAEVRDWHMPTFAAGMPAYEDPGSVASTIVINFIEP